MLKIDLVTNINVIRKLLLIRVKQDIHSRVFSCSIIRIINN